MALIRLSEAIENLREELARAKEEGHGKDVNFNIGMIELDLQVVAENETSAGAKINWWIFGGGLDAKVKGASTHRLKLTLEPVDSQGKAIRVSRQEMERAE